MGVDKAGNRRSAVRIDVLPCGRISVLDADTGNMSPLNHDRAGDFTAITRRINGGNNGMADRLAHWDRALKVLT